MIINLLKKLDVENKIKENKYTYNNYNVPRVNTILSAMLHEDYLLSWSNFLGLIKRQSYNTYMKNAADIGTMSHEFIEKYISDNTYFFDISKESINKNMEKVKNCLDSFIIWYNKIIKNNKIKILGMEKVLVCPWFGGTYDLLISINDKIFLTDFKTSNHVGYRYFLQLSAYRYMLEFFYNIHIDGTIILQVDKYEPSFEEYVLDFSNKQHLEFINSCQECFLSLVYAYYQRLQVEQEFNNIRWLR